MECKYDIIKAWDKKALVDIVVLTCNGKNVTEDFLSFLYKNTDHKLFHLIVVDNGSEDDTKNFLVEYAKTHTSISLVFNDKNYGVIEGRNLGFHFSEIYQETQNPYIMFLDNDQYVQKDWFDQHMSLLCMGYDIVGVEAWLLSDRLFPVQKNKNINQRFSYVGCGGMVMKREVPNKIGMFDERFSPAYFEDPDFSIRAYKAGFKIGWNYKAKIIHMPHQTLGKLKHEEKSKIFANSLKKFREKWKNEKPMLLKQEPF
jgi:GT2 family glycosyltransferase